MLNLVALDAHDGDVESSATEIEHENSLVLFQFVETVGNGRRSRLIDNLENVETGQLAGGDGGGPFRVVEIRRDSNDRVGHWLLQIFFGVVLELAKNQRRQFFRRINFPIELAMKLVLRFAHLAFDEVDDAFGFGHRIVLGQRTYHRILPFEQNHRGRDALAFRIRNNLRFSVLVDVCDRRESRAEIDADGFALRHDGIPFGRHHGIPVPHVVAVFVPEHVGISPI